LDYEQLETVSIQVVSHLKCFTHPLPSADARLSSQFENSKSNEASKCGCKNVARV
jgi:hypothetical protein